MGRTPAESRARQPGLGIEPSLVLCQVTLAPLKAAFTVREKRHWEVTGLSRVDLLLAQMDEVYARLWQRLEGLTDVE